MLATQRRASPPPGRSAPPPALTHRDGSYPTDRRVQVRAAQDARRRRQKMTKSEKKALRMSQGGALTTASDNARWGDAKRISELENLGGWSAHTARGASARAQAIVDDAAVRALRLSHILLATEAMADLVLDEVSKRIDR